MVARAHLGNVQREGAEPRPFEREISDSNGNTRISQYYLSSLRRCSTVISTRYAICLSSLTSE